MSLTYRPPVAGSPLKRKFFYLGVEREDRPPRDYETPAAPGESRISYVPRTFGPNEEEDLKRLTTYDASGEAPPKPHYLTDIDRARHFVHLLGGMDVAPHFANRPSFLLCRGGSLPMQHSELYKSVLAAKAEELASVEQQLSHSPSRRRQQIPEPLDTTSSTSPSAPQRKSLHYLSSVEVSSFRMSPTPVPLGGSLQQPSPSPSSPTMSVGRGSSSVGRGPAAGGAAAKTSLEVALSSSKLHASSVVRYHRRLQEQRNELAELSRAHHPNQLITYVEN